MNTDFIPSNDPRCLCGMGKSDDEDAVNLLTSPGIIPGQGAIPFFVNRNCLLHEEWAKILTRNAAKGLSI